MLGRIVNVIKESKLDQLSTSWVMVQASSFLCLRLGSFQTQIIECKAKPLVGESAHMMIMPLRESETQLDGAWPLLPGLHILHTYTWIKMSSSKVSINVRNMSDNPIFLTKGVWVPCKVSASPVPPLELSQKMEPALCSETA